MGLENNIPEDWVVTNLGEQDIEVLSGYAFKSKNFTTNKLNESYLPVLKIKNVANGDANHKDVVFHIVSKETEKYIIKKGDVLIALTGNHPFAKTQVVGGISKYRLNQKSLLNQRVAKLYSGKPNKLSDSFMYFFFKWSNTQFHIGNQSSGSASQANISKNDILNIPINLPTLAEQKAIAKVLNTFDDKIELLQAQNKTLETMAQTIFKEWFGKYQIGDELPEGWRVGKLGDILETYLGGTPSKSKNEYWDNGSIPWINSGEVNNFRITRGTTLITKLGLEKSATKLLPKGTVLIAITGATLGQYSILEIESCFNQSVVGIVGNNKIKSSFIYFWIANNIHAIIRNATGGAQQHINKENVNSFEMIIPSDEFLNKFQSIVEPMMDKITNNEFETQSLIKTRDTLLPKLMSGKVRVNNIKQTVDA